MDGHEPGGCEADDAAGPDDEGRVARVLAQLKDAKLDRALAKLSAAEMDSYHTYWPAWARRGQAPPPGDWRVWVMMAGRGFGKTRSGAEWVSEIARRTPALRAALVAASLDEGRAVMIEGRSGLLSVARPGERRAMRWSATRGLLTFANGATAQLYSGAHPSGLRGPEHDIAWCDEIAKWPRARDAWDNLLLGLRLGERPRVLVTTTPIPGPLLPAILAEPGTVLTRGRTRDNPHLPAAFRADMQRLYAGTRLGRQELDGELIEDVEGALWTQALIAGQRCAKVARAGLRRVVVGVDPPASQAGTCGIVVCGSDGGSDDARRLLVVDDRSIAGASPEGWARAVMRAASDWNAQVIVVETNQGGEMVEAVLRGAGGGGAGGVRVQAVTARLGKAARAEPVAAEFERGTTWLAGRFDALEAQLTGMVAGDGYRGPGASPDRADAMVWALAALAGGEGEPRVRGV